MGQGFGVIVDLMEQGRGRNAVAGERLHATPQPQHQLRLQARPLIRVIALEHSSVAVAEK